MINLSDFAVAVDMPERWTADVDYPVPGLAGLKAGTLTIEFNNADAMFTPNGMLTWLRILNAWPRSIGPAPLPIDGHAYRRRQLARRRRRR